MFRLFLLLLEDIFTDQILNYCLVFLLGPIWDHLLDKALFYEKAHIEKPLMTIDLFQILAINVATILGTYIHKCLPFYIANPCHLYTRPNQSHIV